MPTRSARPAAEILSLMISKRLLLFWLGIALAALVEAFSQETKPSSGSTQTPRVIQKLRGPVTLDGLSDEDAWKDIHPLPMVMHIPTFGIPPSEKTEVLIAFDDDFFYVAGRLYEKDPTKIQSPSKKRDYGESNSDWLCVSIDTFNDKENALSFCTNPSGLRSDVAVFNDAVIRSNEGLPSTSASANSTSFFTAGESGFRKARPSASTAGPAWSAASAPGSWVSWICRPRPSRRKGFHQKTWESSGSAAGYSIPTLMWGEW